MECLDYQYVYDTPLPIGRMMTRLGNKMQQSTQRYDRRPYGVGLLVIGYDGKGPHLYQTCPSANYYDCKAMAIGARSQSARTYLEKHLASFYECDLNQLVAHALRALRDTLPSEMELTNKVRCCLVKRLYIINLRAVYLDKLCRRKEFTEIFTVNVFFKFRM
jgi:20S proteasome subunit alpha 6